MSTIAYRDGELAADSQSSKDGVATTGVVKIKAATNDSEWSVMGKRVIAYAVDNPSVSAMEFVRRALTEGLSEYPPSNPAQFRSVHAMLITEDGECFTWAYTHMPILGNQLYHDIKCHTAPCAIGTGRAFAMGAMAIGGSAIEGVLAGISLDVFSGGEVQGFVVEDYLIERAAERADLAGGH